MQGKVSREAEEDEAARQTLEVIGRRLKEYAREQLTIEAKDERLHSIAVTWMVYDTPKRAARRKKNIYIHNITKQNLLKSITYHLEQRTLRRILEQHRLLFVNTSWNFNNNNNNNECMNEG